MLELKALRQVAAQVRQSWARKHNRTPSLVRVDIRGIKMTLGHYLKGTVAMPVLAVLTAAGAHAGTLYPVKAEAISPPSTLLVTAPLLAPGTVGTLYGSGTTHTVGVSGSGAGSPEIQALAKSLLGSRDVNNPTDQAAFIQNVLTYVRNNIDTELRFGLSKGAKGALVDQSGTDFDQADLMVALLQAGGVSATYEFGTVTLNATQFGRLTGLVTGLNASNQTFTVNAAAACQLLADGGIPASVNGSTPASCSSLSGSLTTVTMTHAWVQVGSTTYDPSYKAYTLKASIDISSAMGCGSASSSTCGSSLATSLGSGATTGTEQGLPYVAKINPQAAHSTLMAQATNLENYILANNRQAEVADIVGGKDLNDQSGIDVPTYGSATGWTAIPDQYRTAVTVHVAGNPGPSSDICVSFFADEIGGRVLAFSFPGNLTPNTPYSARLDSDYIVNLSYTPVRTMTCPSSAATGPSAVPYTDLTVDHPYAAAGGTYADETIRFKPVDDPHFETGIYRHFDQGSLVLTGAGSGQKSPTDYPEQDYLGSWPVTVIFNFGQARSSALRHVTDVKSVMTGDGNLCEATTASNVIQRSCNVQDQAIPSGTFNYYRTLSDALVDGVANVKSTRHHDIGIIYGSRSPGINRLSMQETLSVNSTSANAADRTAAFNMQALTLSEVEGAVSPNQNGVPVSFATMFFADKYSPIMYGNMVDPTTNAALYGTLGLRRFYFLNTASIATYLSMLQAGTHADGSAVYPYECITYTTPNGSDGCWRASQIRDVANLGYSAIFPEGGDADYFYKGSNEQAYTIWEYMKGASAVVDPLGTALKKTEVMDAAALARKEFTVDHTTGTLSFTAEPDLTDGAGDFPASLPFVRSFTPSEREQVNSSSVTYVVSGGQTGGTATNNTINLATAGGSSMYNDRLGGGWVHNYDVFLNLTSDNARQLGSDFALDAAAPIAQLRSMYDLANNTGQIPQLAFMFAGLLLGSSQDAIVKEGAANIAFHRLADGRYYSVDHPNAKLSLTYTCGAALNCNVGSYTGEGGDVISFSYYKSSGLQYDTLHGTVSDNGTGQWARIYKADSWSFVNGVALTFNYTLYPFITPNTGSTGYLGCPTCSTTNTYPAGYVLTSVSNNLGRKLTFTSAPLPANAGTSNSSFGYLISKVTDENGQSVSFATSDDSTCTTFTCNYFSATDNAGNVTRYEFKPGTDSPDPTEAVRPNFQLRRWYSPRSTTTPFETFVYDSIFRMAKVTDRNGHTSTYNLSGIFGSEYSKRAEIVSPMSETSIETYNEKNLKTRVQTPLGYVTTTSYDRMGHPLVSVLPEGNGTQTTYDVRGNPIQVRKFSKTCGAAATSCADDIISSTAYMEGPTVVFCTNGITCDKPASETDALSNTTNYSWDSATGNLTQILKPAILSANDGSNIRPETDVAYTKVNGISLVTSKVDKIDGTHSTTTTYGYDSSNSNLNLQSIVVDSSGLSLRTCLKFDAVGNLIYKTDPKAGLAVCQ
jgi:Tfp pilus assembly protein PilE